MTCAYNRNYGNPHGTCCKLKSCWKFEIVPANFQNDLLQSKKRMFLPIKISKEFYIFEREAVRPGLNVAFYIRRI